MRSSGLLQGIYLEQNDPLMNSTTFTDPFRYAPHPLVREAAKDVIGRIDASHELAEAFAEGKMLGVLIVEDGSYLAAFSGNVGGRSHIDGFVPPIYDLLDPSGHFKIKEAEITALNQKIKLMEQSPALESRRKDLIENQRSMDEEIGAIRERMSVSKRERDEIRKGTDDRSILSDLIRESQYEKAQLRRIRNGWEEKIGMIKADLHRMLSEIQDLKKIRAEKSDILQKWIFGQYIVSNSLGEKKSIWEIFAARGLTPPGGTGECAAPKLLNYAYTHGLKPIAMGEFWYGRSPDTAVRTHGRFYPSCTSKCGPLLAFMTEGLSLQEFASAEDNDIRIIYEDETLIAVSKPSGIPSVPGLDGRTSVLERLSSSGKTCIAVHRLDMDTSGVLLFAKTPEAAVALQRQFEERSVRKTYMARLAPAPEGKQLRNGEKGRISLPLCADHDERPRQKADMVQGKEAVTEYEVISTNMDGTTDMIFHPLTGRTHQLRAHSAHHLGLGRPILGDLLYGGFAPASAGTPHPDAVRLHLHARSISLTHPTTGRPITINSDEMI